MHMERVKGQHLHLRRVLEKQLDELDHDYRQIEVKREREIRSLGVDLTKMHKFTKDLNEIFTEDATSPTPPTRRASLPCFNSPRPLTSPAIPTIGRQRRLSVVTPPTRSRLELLNALTSEGVPLHSPFDVISAGNGHRNLSRRISNSSDSGDEKGTSTPVRRRSREHLSTKVTNSASSPGGMTLDGDRRGSKTAVKVMSSQAEPTRRGSKSGIEPQSNISDNNSPLKIGGRRGSLEGGTKIAIANGNSSLQNQINGKATRRGSKCSEPEISHNETKTYVHRDGQEPLLVSDDAPNSVSSDEKEETYSASMFDGRKSRRASEPALGGHFLRTLQAKAKGEENSEARAHHTLTPAEEELRKSIVKELPSKIVAEEDEDRYNEENYEETTEVTAASKKTNVDGSSVEDPQANADAKPKKTEPNPRPNTAGKAENGRQAVSSAKSSVRLSIQENSTVERKQSTKTGPLTKFAKQTQRRKSEGDVLKFARIWKIQADNNNKSKSKESRDYPATETPGDSTKLGIWDAVRKCRYIRGYNPPEMDDTGDLGEFVFGHSFSDSVTTK